MKIALISHNNMTHSQSPAYLKSVEPVRSIPLLCVRERLALKTELKDVWYKDEGGKVSDGVGCDRIGYDVM
jgi:hypothetical protein